MGTTNVDARGIGAPAGKGRQGLSSVAAARVYRCRNDIERAVDGRYDWNEVQIKRELLRRLKRFRLTFSRFDKLDLVFIAFIYFAVIVEALRQ
jgi:hypothetical protein